MHVVLTQSEGRLAGLAEQLLAAGCSVEHIPLLRIVPIENDLSGLTGCQWWLFTSAASVRLAPPGIRVGAVGPATAKALEELGQPVSLVGGNNALALAQAFMAQNQPCQVGILLGDRSLNTLEDTLVSAGYSVKTALVYKTQSLAWPNTAVPNVVVLASPSAVNALPKSVARQARCVAIGPTTAHRLRTLGIAHTQAGVSVSSIVRTVLGLKGAP
jgi:uroporphyrinogen-III synthase